MIRKTASELAKQADAAMAEAAETVLQRAKQHNTPIIVWRDGKIVELDPYAEEAPRSKSQNPEGNRGS